MDQIRAPTIFSWSHQVGEPSSSSGGLASGRGGRGLPETLVSGFEARVDDAPSSLAVQDRDRSLSYGELDAVANRVAVELLNRLGADSVPVAIISGNGADVIIAMLAVLKAGKFYVVLDPSHPRDRNKHILADAKPALLLAKAQHRLVAVELAGTDSVLELDSLLSGGASRPNVPLSGDDLAWLIYTSGSTGNPKGVVQNHRNAVHNASRQHPLACWSPGDRMTWLYSPGVMGATRGMTAALLYGAALFPRDPRHDSPDELVQWLRRERITVYHSVASLFRSVFGQIEPAEILPDVRLVIFGGESVGEGEVDLVRRHFSTHCRIYTGLGTTETGTVAHILVDPHAPPEGSTLPLGFPVEGVELRLEDQEGTEVGPGEVGEIVVESAHLAAGYWQQPELTALRLAPVEGHSGASRYRTGDLGRIDPAGHLRHVSRKDFQVKIRGFRVETGEIEAALLRHPAVDEAVVVGLPGSAGETVLAAYCGARPPTDLAPQDLRRFLANSLPAHMVPASLTILPALPRTANGKIDRLSLPAPDLAAPLAHNPPAGDVEQRLATIWGELLGRADVPRDQDFFSLGGHSLAVMRLSARIRLTFGVTVSAGTLLERPTIADQAWYIREARGQTDELPLVSTPRSAWLRLSFAQERLWFLHRLDPASATYHMTRAFRLRGNIDPALLRTSLSSVVARHEVLRTIYVDRDGVPAARVLVHAAVPLPVHPLSGASGDATEAVMMRFVEEQAQLPFDLERDIPLRAALGRMGSEVVFVLTVHHIAADAWSLGLLLREVAAAYAAGERGEAPKFPPIPIQYADYAVWQRSHLDASRRKQQIAFWRQALAGAPPRLELPIDFFGGNPGTIPGGVYQFCIPKPIADGMRRLAQGTGATPFIAWLAAFQVLLARHTGATDLVVAVPVGGRTRLELEDVIGCFVNTVLFRANLSRNPTFEDFLSTAAAGARDALKHDELPFDLLVQELQPDRAPGVTPLAQVMFAWEASLGGATEFALRGATPLHAGVRAAKFELTLVLAETDDGLAGVLEYAADRFASATMAAWADRLMVLAEALVQRPRLRVGELPLLRADEVVRLTQDWSGAVVPTEPSTFVDGFARQVQRAPHKPAIRGGGAELTYANLDDLSNSIAEELRGAGVQPGAIVAIFLRRQPQFGAALLGVLKRGAAFLALDPAYPPSRLEFMLRDSAATAIIGSNQDPGWVRMLPLPRVNVDHIGSTPTSPISGRTSPAASDVAYLIYTSGSTGSPKGVAVSHGALWQHNCAIADRFALRPSDRVLQFGALSFDVMIEEIFPTWLRGATVVLRSEDATRSLQAFCDHVATERITVLNLPTAFWHEWVEALGSFEPPTSVRLVVIGGEQGSMERLRQWQQRTGRSVTLLNAYGPTETTVTATVFDATAFGGDSVTGGIPIGRPLPGARAYVLDGYGNPAPVGVWGELYLGGRMLALGYWRQPGLTAERFLPDPFERSPGARMYRTGDVVRWLADGELEFRGRVDQQVKWRGFRIELGEIESALRGLAGVHDAVVTVREEPSGNARIVGYIVGDEAKVDVRGKLAELGQTLPAFMLPAELVVLDALPRSPAGKVDRARLPAPPSVADVAPHRFTSRELQVRAVWEEVLGVPIASPDLDFFSLGGHSLLAVRLFARLEATFGSTPPLVSLFSHPTIRSLAQLLPEAPSPPGAVPVMTLKPGLETAPLVLVHGAGAGLLWGYTTLARHFRGQGAVWAFAPELSVDAASPGRLEDMAGRYVAQLRALQPRGPYYLAGYCFGGNLAYEMARQLLAEGERIGLLAVFDSTPSNSDYHRVRLTGRFLRGFTVNLYLALREFAGLTWSDKFARLRTAARKLFHGSRGTIAAEVEAMIPDPALYTAEEMKLWEAHLRLLRSYHPQPAPVRLVLLRTRRRPLWRSHEPTLGWGALAGAGVQIESVAGTHGTLFHEPHVTSLAAALEKYLSGSVPR